MTVVKTLRFVGDYQWNIKTIVFVSIHDRAVPEAVIIGPVRYFTRRVLVVTHRNLTESEADALVKKVIKTEMRCHKCGFYGDYFKVGIKDGELDVGSAVCGDCDPSVKYTLGLYEAIDIAFIETRDN